MKNVWNLLLPLVVVLSGCQAKAAVKQQSDDQKINLLFVVHAQKGSYSNGELTLIDIDQSVTFFSERPERKAGKLSTEQFIQLWDSSNKESFAHIPPNTGFIFFEDKDTTYSDIPVELLNPRYNQKDRTLSFDVKVLEGRKLPEGQTLEEVTLFIDSVGSIFANILEGSGSLF